MADEITVDELAIERAAGPLTLIDVRGHDEYAAAHVPGARLVPLKTLPEVVDSLPQGERIYVICQLGVRSRRAVDVLRARGIDAVAIEGGTSAWLERGLDYEVGDAS